MLSQNEHSLPHNPPGGRDTHRNPSAPSQQGTARGCPFHFGKLAKQGDAPARPTAFAYGLGAYALFLATFLYAVGFVANGIVPKSIDSGKPAPFGEALLINSLLLGIFAVQHSGMAREGFKRWWTRIVPPVLERSTYVLASCAALGLLYWQWRPIGGVVWSVESLYGRLALWTLCAVGWLIVLSATFLINHFDLFGLRQVYLYLTRRTAPPVGFRTPGLYRFVRHPLYLGFIVAFWSTPVMSAGHLVFAIATTAYILIAIQLEERDLIRHLGQAYIEYRRDVPMLLPIRGNQRSPG